LPPSPTPIPAPTPAGRIHYGAPPCLADEVEGDWSTPFGKDRLLCAASCDLQQGGVDACPAPESGTAKPICLGQLDGFPSDFCALHCGLGKGKCPDGAECTNLKGVPFSDVKVCTWTSADRLGQLIV